MRICDICSTPIPLGSDRCPKCGYRYREERRLNQEERKAKKAKYMSQFQQHPSPLDDLKNKTDTIDFSKVFDRLNDIKISPTRTQRRDGAKTLKRIIITIVVLMAIFTVIPIGVGIYMGLTQVFTDLDYTISDEYEYDYVYEWYDTYDDLQYNFPELAKELDPYYNHIDNLVFLYGDGYGLSESYCVDGEVLDYAYIDASLEVNSNYISAQVYRYSSDVSWQETYYGYDYFDENEVPFINVEILKALSELTDVDYDWFYKNANEFVSNIIVGEEMTIQYYNGNEVFTLDYYSDCVDYSYTRKVEY